MVQRLPKVFVRILLLCVLLVAAVTLIVSTFMYVNLENEIAAQNSQFIQDSLEKAGNSATFMSDWVSNQAIQMLYDSDISILMNMYTVEPNRLPVILGRQKSFKLSATNIFSIYVYNGMTRTFYTETSANYQIPREKFFDAGILPYIDDTSKSFHLKPIPRRLFFTQDGRQIDAEVYTYILYDSPTQAVANSNVIIFNISRKWLDEAIQTLDKNTAADLLIIDHKGLVAYGGGKLAMNADLSADPAIQEVLVGDAAKGYFMTGSGSTKQFITYVRGSGKQADWIYLYRLPAKVLLKDIANTQQAFVRFSIIMLVLGIAGSVAYAVTVYRPFRTMQNRLTEMESVCRSHLESDQQSFLRTILLESTMELAELDFAMAAHGLRCPASSPVRLSLFVLDEYQQFEQDNSHEQRKQKRDALASLIRKHAEPFGPAYTVQTERDCVVLILVDTPGGAADVAAITGAAQAAARETLGQSLSVVYGASNPNWFSLADPYHALRSALPQRVFLGHSCRIDISRQSPQLMCEFPAARERQMCQALLLQNGPEALKCFRDILEAVRDCGGTMLQVALLRTVTAVMETVDKLNRDGGKNIAYRFDSFITRLANYETLQELTGAFEEMISAILRQMNAGKTQTHKEIVDQIVSAIHQRYPEWALSIDSFENLSDFSGIHLTRLFRRYIGESFTDYLRRVRLKKAAELLRTTNEPITKVSEMVGMLNVNHFSTLYKREYGVTPTEYRKQNH